MDKIYLHIPILITIAMSFFMFADLLDDERYKHLIKRFFLLGCFTILFLFLSTLGALLLRGGQFGEHIIVNTYNAEARTASYDNDYKKPREVVIADQVYTGQQNDRISPGTWQVQTPTHECNSIVHRFEGKDEHLILTEGHMLEFHAGDLLQISGKCGHWARIE